VKAVVIGVGNPFRGDDGAGLAVLERLEGRVPGGVELVACEHEPSGMMDAWHGAEAVLIVDAVSSGAAPGALHRFDASAEPLPAHAFRASTHAFAVDETIELARALDRLPRRVLVYGVEGGDFEAGEELTPAVEAAVERTAAAVLSDLANLAKEERPCTSAP